ncbi:uncharacterized protein LOC106866671 isoform X2 [Brachypodium distachyon]|uniref:Mixed lineage kinase domain-containing protein n=1 Tax=Brachypodium distachyon TaxID=15368 RepID=I1IJK5_BRADI|nr:uncharacterized protein LOC106866671 isoform X2 [Brachypodium distachyon]KQJ87386.1 hypothetical protein BRADI_4g10680v3 [Brachypodium distachyon]|eukprot:XP_024318694.1 uncharacterized protein LOC106866671 isoform X2 [Brachypodium distachyon]
MVVADAAAGGVVKLILHLALAIRAAADTAKRNKQDCLEMASRAETLEAALSSLDDDGGGGGTANHQAVASALKRLRLALQRALQAVEGCQGDGALARHLNAGKVSADLRQVNQNITERMMDVILVSGLHTSNLVALKTQHKKKPQIQEDSLANSRKEEEHAFTSSGLSELEAATNNFSKESLIGNNDSRTVYKGELCDGCKDAVKTYSKMQYKACRKERENEKYTVPDHSHGIQASTSIPERTTTSSHCLSNEAKTASDRHEVIYNIRQLPTLAPYSSFMVETKLIRTPISEDVASHCEARQSSIEARVLLLLILFLVLLGFRYG